MSSQTSSHTSKRSRNSTPSTRRTWTAAEERTLIDGLKELCVNGWRGDNGTFKPGYLKELECYLCEHHPNNGLKDWEEIFGKDRATGEFAEGPLDAVKEIQRSQSSVLFNNVSLGFPIDLDGDEEAGSSHRPNVATGEAGNATGATTFPEASQNENAGAFEPEETGSQQTNKQGEYTKRSSNVNEKEKCKKRKKIPENDSEIFLKGMVEVIKNFTDSQDKRMGALIDKIGYRNQSDLRDQIYSIIESPIFELYSIE
ncbi:hypothetical protein RDI58_007944 [Solanum bulbocastanum]|uniref:Uncharacterized protein n=1 Tax=Solanum bulbocastanum TaxID=147425 RepID=A0AAN8TZN3_SOLBU